MTCTRPWLALLTFALLPACGGGGGGGGAPPAGPQVQSTVPPANATGVSVSANLLVTFTADMDPATVTNTTIVLTPSGSGTPVATVVTYDGPTRTAQLDPSADLAGTTSYVLTVTTGVKDAAGVALAADVAVPFTTGAAPDTTPPTFAGATGAAAENANAITVQWSSATDNVDPSGSLRYDLYWSTTTGGQNFATPGATTAPGATSHTITGLNASTAYFVVVRARDSSNNRDANTAEVSATTPAPRSWLNNVWTPILDVHCRSCHTTGAGSMTLVMSSPGVAYGNLVNVNAVACPMKRVEPFSSAMSALYKKVSGTECGTQMPFGLPPLSAADQETIKDWIDEGAPNN